MERVVFKDNCQQVLERVRQVAWEKKLEEQQPVEDGVTFCQAVAFAGESQGILVVFDPSRPEEGADVHAPQEVLDEVRGMLTQNFESLEPRLP